jgi:WD40 repeat protein
VAFSGDGRSLVSASVDRSVRVWENTGREVTPALAGHTRRVLAVAVSPDGKLLASGGEDQSIRLWDAQTGSERQILLGHRGAVTALAFSPDSKTLASGTTEEKKELAIKLWDTAGGKQLASWDLTGTLPAATYTPDGKKLLAWVPGVDPTNGRPVSRVHVFEIAKGDKPVRTIVDDRIVHCLAFSADGELAAMGADDGTVRIWKTGNGEALFPGSFVAHPRRVTDLIFTPDGKTLITGGVDGQLRIFEVARMKPGDDGKPLSFAGHTRPITAFAVSPKGDSFATGGQDNEVKLWDTKTGKELRRWAMRQPVHNLAFTPDGKHIATANADSTVYLLAVP